MIATMTPFIALGRGTPGSRFPHGQIQKWAFRSSVRTSCCRTRATTQRPLSSIDFSGLPGYPGERLDTALRARSDGARKLEAGVGAAREAGPGSPLLGQDRPALVVAPAAADLQIPRREALAAKAGSAGESQ